MSWKLRHEGSPRAIEGLTLEQIVEGLQDGLWEPTDEVMGPEDTNWSAMENHPQLAEVVLEMQPIEKAGHGDETHLDMTALIDVTMVLLIFFIMTTTYAAMQKFLELPGLSPENVNRTIKVKDADIERLMIRAVLRKGPDGATVFKVEDKEVNKSDLVNTLNQYVVKTKKTELLLDCADDVPIQDEVEIQDAAKGAGIAHISLLMKDERKGKK
ncbi:MAG: ExbD/TolR family protein [Gemmataceae bacterium]